MQNTVRFGNDTEAILTIDGQIVLATEIVPPKDDALLFEAKGVGHDTGLTERNKVRLYRDGAAVEVGTGNQPPTCLTWALDLNYTQMAALGAPGFCCPWLTTPKWKPVMADLVPMPKQLILDAPKEAVESGCNPRFDVETGMEVRGIKNYRRYLIEHGAPCGWHLHFGSGGQFCTKTWKMEAIHLERLKVLIAHTLSAYGSMNQPGTFERWQALGVGRFREKAYGMEWTDPGLCIGKNMLMVAAMLGAARVVLLDWDEKQVGRFNSALRFEDVRAALLEGPVAARQVAQAAHTLASELDPSCRDDASPWYAGGNGDANIRKAWAGWVKDGFADDGNGMWFVNYNLHQHGLETGTKRAAKIKKD